MGKKRLQRRITLTPAQIAEGINTAGHNAARLMQDAELLLSAGRYPTAVALSILAVEESAKRQILRELAVAKTPEEIDRCWSDYRNHVKKNVMWAFESYIATFKPESYSDFKAFFDSQSDLAGVIEHIKQRCFYTAFFSDGTFGVPEDVVGDADTARTLVQNARAALDVREVTAEEIELWIQHLGPVWKTSPEEIKRGFRDFFREAKKRGFITVEDAALERFLLLPSGAVQKY